MKKNETIKSLKPREARFIVNGNEQKEKTDEKVITQNMKVNQGKLVIGLDILEITEEEKYIASVYNILLGGSSNSKLFQNVREKASLAYTTNSNFSYVSGNIFVNAGIDIPNFEKTLDISKKQVESMKNGEFDETDIENAKKTIISNILSIDDEQDTEIIYFLGQTLSDQKVTLEEYIDMINRVKKEQIIEFAKMVKINTIYFLKN